MATKAIDAMVGERLMAPQEDEVKHKDSGREEIDRKECASNHKYRGKDDLEKKIADLSETINGLTTDAETLKGDIAAMKTEQVTLKASEDREAETKVRKKAPLSRPRRTRISLRSRKRRGLLRRAS